MPRLLARTPDLLTTEHLIDDTVVAIRPLTPADDAAVIALHAGLDNHDSYLRFFAPRPKDLVPVAASITAQDTAHGAIGAFDGPRLIGAANFVVGKESNVAEIAMVVAHDEQLQGVGTLLLRRLRVLARQHNVSRFVAEVLAENVRMLRVLSDIGWPTTRCRSGGAIHVEIDLE